jgi:hypothetical protein
MTQNSSTKGNPDIVNPPNAGKKAIPFSRPGVGYNGSAKIDSWAEAPLDGDYILYSSGGEIKWGLKAPAGAGTSVLASVGGVIQWIGTTDCDATPTP